MTGEDEDDEVRPGLRVLPGNDFVLPAGSITISLMANGPEILEPIVAKARYQAWPDWLQIALDAALAANEGRRGLLAATAEGDEDAEVGFLMSEFRATLTAVTASAFALDSFYAVISTFYPLRSVERAARIRRGTGRSAWVFDALRRVTKLTNEEAKSLRQRVRTIYRLRDMAVHPSYELSDFLVHPRASAGGSGGLRELPNRERHGRGGGGDRGDNASCRSPPGAPGRAR